MNVGQLKRLIADHCNDDFEIKSGVVPLSHAYVSSGVLQLIFPGDEDDILGDELFDKYAEDLEDSILDEYADDFAEEDDFEDDMCFDEYDDFPNFIPKGE